MEHSRLVSPFVMWAFVAAAFGVAWTVLPARYLWHRSYAEGLVAGALLCYWTAMVLSAHRVNRSAAANAMSTQRIVTNGPYALVRHPIFSGDIAAALALLLIAPNVRMIVSCTIAIAVFAVWMELEERVLLARFGETYRTYQQNVPRFIPLHRRRSAA